MAYILQALADNTILQIISGHYSISELSLASKEMAGLIDKMACPSYILVDLTKMDAIESNIIAVRDAVQPLLSHPQLALILAYGNSDSAVINFLGSFMASIFKIPVKTVRNQEQAIQYLIKQDPSLDGKLQERLRRLEQSV